MSDCGSYQSPLPPELRFGAAAWIHRLIVGHTADSYFAAVVDNLLAAAAEEDSVVEGVEDIVAADVLVAGSPVAARILDKIRGALLENGGYGCTWLLVLIWILLVRHDVFAKNRSSLWKYYATQTLEVTLARLEHTRTTARLYILLVVVSPSAVVKSELENMWRHTAGRSLVRQPILWLSASALRAVRILLASSSFPSSSPSYFHWSASHLTLQLSMLGCLWDSTPLALQIPLL